jgi:hypothetical protein
VRYIAVLQRFEQGATEFLFQNGDHSPNHLDFAQFKYSKHYNHVSEKIDASINHLKNKCNM